MKYSISDVKITVSPQDNGLLGFASLVLNKSIFLGSIGVWKTDQYGIYRVTYPTKGKKENEVFHPIDKELHGLIIESITGKIKELF